MRTSKNGRFTMDPMNDLQLQINRRYFFGRSAIGIGGAALASLLSPSLSAAAKTKREHKPGVTHPPHFRPKAKRVIYLFQSGGPSQLDLYDYKPELQKRFGQEVPRSVYPDERKTTMTLQPTQHWLFRWESWVLNYLG